MVLSGSSHHAIGTGLGTYTLFHSFVFSLIHQHWVVCSKVVSMFVFRFTLMENVSNVKFFSRKNKWKEKFLVYRETLCWRHHKENIILRVFMNYYPSKQKFILKYRVVFILKKPHSMLLGMQHIQLLKGHGVASLSPPPIDFSPQSTSIGQPSWGNSPQSWCLLVFLVVLFLKQFFVLKIRKLFFRLENTLSGFFNRKQFSENLLWK